MCPLGTRAIDLRVNESLDSVCILLFSSLIGFYISGRRPCEDRGCCTGNTCAPMVYFIRYRLLYCCRSTCEDRGWLSVKTCAASLVCLIWVCLILGFGGRASILWLLLLLIWFSHSFVYCHCASLVTRHYGFHFFWISYFSSASLFLAFLTSSLRFSLAFWLSFRFTCL